MADKQLTAARRHAPDNPVYFIHDGLMGFYDAPIPVTYLIADTPEGRGLIPRSWNRLRALKRLFAVLAGLGYLATGLCLIVMMARILFMVAESQMTGINTMDQSFSDLAAPVIIAVVAGTVMASIGLVFHAADRAHFARVVKRLHEDPYAHKVPVWSSGDLVSLPLYKGVPVADVLFAAAEAGTLDATYERVKRHMQARREKW